MLLAASQLNAAPDAEPFAAVVGVSFSDIVLAV